MMELPPLPTLNDSSIRHVICIKLNCIQFLLSVLLNLGRREVNIEREAGGNCLSCLLTNTNGKGLADVITSPTIHE